MSTAHASICTQPPCYSTNTQSCTTHITNITSPVPTCAKMRDRQWLGSCGLKVSKVLKFTKGYKQSVVKVFCHSKASISKLTLLEDPDHVVLSKNNQNMCPIQQTTWAVNKCVLTLQKLKGDYQQNVKWRCEGSTYKITCYLLIFLKVCTR